MNFTKTEIYYNIFFKNFLNIFILVSGMKKTQFLNLNYKKENLNFYNKKLKKKRILLKFE